MSEAPRSEPRELLDPEVEVLLREIAADPDSTLLRRERPHRLRDVSEDHFEASVRSIPISPAERKLLECYREEVAFLLRYEYYLRFCSNERFANLRRLRLREAFRGVEPHLEPVGERREELVELMVQDHRGDSATRLVVECVAPSRAPESVPVLVAAASLRLHPTEAGRLYVAFEHCFSGSTTSSLRVSRDVAERSPTPHGRAYALNAVGLAHAKRGETRLAFEAYAEAHELAPEFLESSFEALGLAAQLGEQDALLRIARAADELFAHRPDDVAAWIRTLTLARDEGRWSPTSEAETCVHRVADRLGGVSAAVLDTFGRSS